MATIYNLNEDVVSEILRIVIAQSDGWPLLADLLCCAVISTRWYRLTRTSAQVRLRVINICDYNYDDMYRIASVIRFSKNHNIGIEKSIQCLTFKPIDLLVNQNNSRYKINLRRARTLLTFIKCTPQLEALHINLAHMHSPHALAACQFLSRACNSWHTVKRLTISNMQQVLPNVGYLDLRPFWTGMITEHLNLTTIDIHKLDHSKSDIVRAMQLCPLVSKVALVLDCGGYHNGREYGQLFQAWPLLRSLSISMKLPCISNAFHIFNTLSDYCPLLEDFSMPFCAPFRSEHFITGNDPYASYLKLLVSHSSIFTRLQVPRWHPSHNIFPILARSLPNIEYLDIAQISNIPSIHEMPPVVWWQLKYLDVYQTLYPVGFISNIAKYCMYLTTVIACWDTVALLHEGFRRSEGSSIGSCKFTRD